jgi:hypothetical protein
MHRLTAALAGCLITAALAPSIAVAQSGRVRAGTLTCDISAGMGFIIGSHKNVTCVYRSHRWRETYTGSINKFGLDLGATAGGRMVWSVYAPTTAGHGALAGDYSGASAEATVGAGLGANVLVGGSSRTIALQPVSVQGQTGLNVAVGVSGLTLRPVKPPHKPRRRHR